jgi:hypothetical protein
MPTSIYPAVSSSKTMYRTTLLSGTSWTVPAGVTYLNVTLYGAGGSAGTSGTSADGRTAAAGGGGQIVSSTLSCTPGASITYAIGAGGTAVTATSNQGTGGNVGGNTTFTGATTALGGGAGSTGGGGGPAGGLNYGFWNGSPAPNGSTGSLAPAGGPGKIDIEYWA